MHSFDLAHKSSKLLVACAVYDLLQGGGDSKMSELTSSKITVAGVSPPLPVFQLSPPILAISAKLHVSELSVACLLS